MQNPRSIVSITLCLLGGFAIVEGYPTATSDVCSQLAGMGDGSTVITADSVEYDSLRKLHW
jgi:hypothetical protein